MRAFLEACEEPAVKRIALTDAPAVLGWEEWREIDNRHGLGLTRAALAGAVEAGVLRQIPLEAMSHLLVAALSEAAFVIANADGPGGRPRGDRGGAARAARGAAGLAPARSAAMSAMAPPLGMARLRVEP